MTQTRVWLTIAEAFGTPVGERTREQASVHSRGLLDLLGPMGSPAHCEAWDTFVSCANWTERDEWRCLLACLFAAMSPAERREIGLPG